MYDPIMRVLTVLEILQARDRRPRESAKPLRAVAADRGDDKPAERP